MVVKYQAGAKWLEIQMVLKYFTFPVISKSNA